jgi:hypothetical protein
MVLQDADDAAGKKRPIGGMSVHLIRVNFSHAHEDQRKLATIGDGRFTYWTIRLPTWSARALAACRLAFAR